MNKGKAGGWQENGLRDVGRRVGLHLARYWHGSWRDHVGEKVGLACGKRLECAPKELCDERLRVAIEQRMVLEG